MINVEVHAAHCQMVSTIIISNGRRGMGVSRSASFDEGKMTV